MDEDNEYMLPNMILAEVEIGDDDTNDDTIVEPVATTEVSCLERCNTTQAKKLRILDLDYKLMSEGNYSIGGCYTYEDPDLWFYYTTTVIPQQVYLMNLFVCYRKTGSFAIGISNSNEISFTTVKKIQICSLPDSLSWYRFDSSHKDQSHYIKTFSFTHNAKERLKNSVVLIPINIIVKQPCSLNTELLQLIKLEHNKKAIELPDEKEADFVFISASGKRYPVHKIIVMAHSSVLTESMKGSSSSLQIDLGDSEVELMIHYMYNGVIKDISMQDINKLLDIAHKFQFIPLSDLIKYLIEKQIDVMNAVDVALVAKKYNLLSVRAKVFNFIKENPKVFGTDAWKNLNDIELAKSLVEHNQFQDTDQ